MLVVVAGIKDGCILGLDEMTYKIRKLCLVVGFATDALFLSRAGFLSEGEYRHAI